jgi:hypothetical protein
MTDLLEWFHTLLRFSHISVGGLGLVLFWVPVFATKGGRLHIACGRVFVWTAYWVATTSLVSSAWGIISPISFLGARGAALDSARQAAVSENFRFIFAILGFLGFAVLTSTAYGVRVVRTRRDHSQVRTPLILALHGCSMAAAVALFLFGAITLVLSYAGRGAIPSGEAAKYWVPTILGSFTVISVYTEIRYVMRPRPTPMAWWYKHMEQMLGVGVGFHTAFLVFGAQRLVPIQVEGAWRLLPWILPTLVGAPAIQLWVRSYRRKFGELHASADRYSPQSETAPASASTGGSASAGYSGARPKQ